MNSMHIHQPASLDNLTLENTYSSAPGAGEIQVRIHAGSLNFRDGLVVNGFFPVKDGLIPLSDGAGEVIAIGEGVTNFSVGDRVVSVFHPNWQDGHIDRTELNNSPGGPADGFACETVTKPMSHFTKAPKNLSYLESSTLPCAGVTAWRAIIADGKVRPGERVLILGTGGVSLFALQFAKAGGANVVAITSTPEKEEKLRKLGADHVINYKDNPDWGQAVVDWSGGIGVEHVVEVGGPNTLKQSLIAARTGGHVAIIGAVGGFDIDTMPFAIVQAKRLCLQAVTVGSRRDQIDMINAIEAHNIRPVIGDIYPLDRLADGFRALQSGNTFGKVCIEI